MLRKTLLSFTLLPLLSTISEALSSNMPHDELAGVAGAEGSLDRRTSVDNAQMGFYNADTGGQNGACGVPLTNSAFTVALSQINGNHCFELIAVSYNGKTAQAQILDVCLGCPRNGLDLTPALFSYLSALSNGVIIGSWTTRNGTV